VRELRRPLAKLGQVYLPTTLAAVLIYVWTVKEAKMRRSNAAPIAAMAFVLAAVLAVPSTALADKKKPKDTTETPKENIQLNYGSVQWTYKQQKPGQGTSHPAPNSGVVGGSMRR